MSSGEAFIHNPERHDDSPAKRLLRYLRGQFVDAYDKEAAELRRGERAIHGSFVQRVPLDVGHALTRGADRIVMKSPHPKDQPGYYCEAFLILLAERREYEHRQDVALTADKFLIRQYTDNRPGPFWLIDGEGAHPADVDLDAITFDSIALGETTSQYRAEEMLEQISTYNIVAASDQGS
jgi:hypothetical protein